jgi:hypothetical protein
VYAKAKIPVNESDKKIDVDSTHSVHAGMKGAFERALRRFKRVMSVVVLLQMYVVGGFCVGIALFPAVLFVQVTNSLSDTNSAYVRAFTFALSLGVGFFIFGFSLLIVVPLVTGLLRAYPEPFRGPYYSIQSIKWALHNGLTYLPRYLFLDFVTPTPFNIAFYRAMGMKIGKGVQINTTAISDAALIEIGDKATIGGSATVIAHYAQGGFLVIAPTKIGRGATIGLRAIVMGGVTVGDGAKVLPNSVVLPKTEIPAGETWGGVPAVRIK